MLNDIFEQPEKKPSRKRGPVSAAEFERILKRVEFPNEKVSENVPISGIRFLDVRDFVIQYWQGLPSANSGHKRLFTDVGTLVHEIIQESLFNIGVLECPGCETFTEMKVFSEELFLSGRVDGIISPQRIKHFDKDLEGDLPEWTDKIHLEIKTCSKEKFQYLQHESLIQEEYRASATCYQKLLNTEMTCFLFVCRDDMAKKTLFYRGEPEFWEDAEKKCRQIWKHVRNHTLPPLLGECKMGLDTPELMESWIQQQKARQPERKFRDV